MTTETRPYITLTDQWQDVYLLSGVTPGDALVLENIGAETCEIHISMDKPAERPANVGAHSIYPLVTKYVERNALGCWARNKPDTKGTRLQVAELGTVSTTTPERLLVFPSLFLKFDPFTQLTNTASFALVRNRTDAAMILNQVVNFESYSQGLQEGTSILEYEIYFNVDLTGATAGVSIGKAYANGIDGTFDDRTGNGVDIADLDGFNPGINPDFLKIAGNTVSYFSTQQSTAVSIANETISFERPIIIPPAGEFVVGYKNTSIIDGGTDTTTTSLLSGQFVNDPITVLPPSTADFDTDFTEDFA